MRPEASERMLKEDKLGQTKSPKEPYVRERQEARGTALRQKRERVAERERCTGKKRTRSMKERERCTGK